MSKKAKSKKAKTYRPQSKVASETPSEIPNVKDASPDAEAPSKKLSGLDAAAKVLADAGEPLNCRAIVERAIAQGLWQSGGKTPHATIYSAIIREIARGEGSRFRKTDRGLFTVAS